MDLVTYSLAKENNLLNASINAFSAGRLEAAIGFLTSYANLLNIKMPPKSWQMLNHTQPVAQRKALEAYYFHAMELVSAATQENIEEIRQKMKSGSFKIIHRDKKEPKKA